MTPTAMANRIKSQKIVEGNSLVLAAKQTRENNINSKCTSHLLMP